MQGIFSPVTISVAVALVLSGSYVNAQNAEDAAAACTEASRLIGEQDYVGALDEAEWCIESLRQLKQQLTLTVFPDTINGFEGGELDNHSGMGMTVIERIYVLDDQSVKVALTGGVAGGGLAALAQFASGMSGAGGAKTRIQKRTVVDMSNEGSDVEFMVQMKSGGMLMISSGDLNSEAVLEFIRKFPIEQLDESMMP